MIDFTPLFRTAAGFDRLASTLQEATRVETGWHPPYDIEATGQDRYRITMAVAGFGKDALEVEVKQNLLRVVGKKAEEDGKPRRYLHRSVASRAFELRFQLADHVRVVDAQVSDGLLHIELVREVPEALKSRRVEIGTGTAKPALATESKAA